MLTQCGGATGPQQAAQGGGSGRAHAPRQVREVFQGFERAAVAAFQVQQAPVPALALAAQCLIGFLNLLELARPVLGRKAPQQRLIGRAHLRVGSAHRNIEHKEGVHDVRKGRVDWDPPAAALAAWGFWAAAAGAVCRAGVVVWVCWRAAAWVSCHAARAASLEPAR